MEENKAGNPDVGNKIFGSSENFFEALEKDVNSAITDSQEKQTATPESKSAPVEATREKAKAEPENNVDWEKRYKDSSREAQRLSKKLKDMEKHAPIIDAMKKDQGLVDHVKDYVTNGGRQKSVMDDLKLGEDFVFDAQEAMADPASDSAKVMNAHISKAVNTRVAKAQDIERRRLAQAQRQQQMDQEARDFKEKHKMSDEDFDEMMAKAKNHKMSIEDLFYVVNREKANANIANNTKQEMLDQMKNVRDIPSSSAGVNSAQVEQKYEDEVFDALKGSDGDIESIFSDNS